MCFDLFGSLNLNIFETGPIIFLINRYKFASNN